MQDVVVKDSRISGKGVFAGRNFKKGETVLTWHPKILTNKEVTRLSKNDKNYLIEGKQNLLMQPPERYVNHSCDSNTKPTEKSDVAIKDIKIGEEITSDYSRITSVSFTCHCGSKNCHGFIE